MTNPIPTAGVNHISLTVSDVARAQQFYSDLLGFRLLTMFGPRALLHNGSVILGLGPAPDPDQVVAGDRFNENRIGLDHVSFNVAGMADMEAAASLLDAQGVSRGEINRLDAFGIAVMAFRDRYPKLTHLSQGTSGVWFLLHRELPGCPGLTLSPQAHPA